MSMNLKLPAPVYETLEFDGGSISLRALRTSELTNIGGDIAQNVADLFDHSFQADPAAMLADKALVRGIMTVLLQRGPDIITKAIALAADGKTDEDFAAVAELPLDVTVAALERIIALTFPDPQRFASIAAMIGDLTSKKSAAISAVRQ